jgi:hypothetical protein
VLPNDVPNTQPKTTNDASFGKYSKKFINITNAIDPPPIPANVAKLFVSDNINVPIIVHIVGGHK